MANERWGKLISLLMKEERYDGISKKMIHGQRPCAVGASLIGRPRAFLAQESIFSDLNFHGDGRSFSRQLQKNPAQHSQCF
ncbi:hypothetical protein [uncultured Megasphaera sp.]|uniref:hypothetical protein n=1 Tax=uncultured Megasphaera sp. TaxID=165188 RepID=UPI0025F0C53D|nr:hypothetical protein [uncultured Megasphaera sp.]